MYRQTFCKQPPKMRRLGGRLRDVVILQESDQQGSLLRRGPLAMKRGCCHLQEVVII